MEILTFQIFWLNSNGEINLELGKLSWNKKQILNELFDW